jgi:nucleoside-diphosphate-sugar epimerase
VNWLSTDLWRGRRVLVTGGSGFIGEWVGQLLIQAGAEVHSSWRTNPPKWRTFAHLARLPQHAEALVHTAQPEWVIHLASPIPLDKKMGCHDKPSDGIIEATRSLLTAAQQTGARFIFAGTCAEYGACSPPYCETQVPQPQSLYGQLKWAASQLVLDAGGTVVRPFRAIGPGDTRSVVASAAKAAILQQPFRMTEGHQVREWNHVHAIAKGILAASMHPETQGSIVNLGGGEHRSVFEVVKEIFQAAGAPVDLIQRGALPLRSGEVSELVGNHQKAYALWGEIPQPTLATTLRESLSWIRATAGANA